MPVVDIKFPSFIDLWTLSAEQAAFINDSSKLKFLCCGRFGGKTFLALIDACFAALRLYATRFVDKTWWRPGPLVTVGIFAPTERNHKAIWKQLTGIIPQIPGTSDGMDNTTVLRGAYSIYLFGFQGIQIDCISCYDADNVRGDYYDIALVDEAAQLRKPTVWSRQIKPMVIRVGCYGKVTILSTPLNNFFDRWCVSARDSKGRFKNFAYHHWTCWENPGLTEDQIEEILIEREEDESTYRQEYLAELFVEHAAEELIAGEKVWNAANLEPIWQTETIICRGPWVVGLDLAWQGNDNFAAVAIDVPTQFVCHMEVHRKTTDKDLLDIVERLHRQFNNPKFFFDRTGAKAHAWAELLPPTYDIHPLIFRRSIDRNRHADYVVSKDLLIRSLTQRMTLGRLKVPDPDEYDFSTLPWANQQDMQINFKRFKLEALALERKTVKKYDGKEEYLYVPGIYPDPQTGKSVAHEDTVDGVIVALRGMPAIAEKHVCLDDLIDQTNAWFA